jgi:metallo-beta-lactamase class B
MVWNSRSPDETGPDSFDEAVGLKMSRLREYYTQPSSARCRPFRIAGNLYYVGDTRVCSHLLDTGDGLIIFDSGYQHTIHLLVQSIWELGYDPADISYIFHTHGHFDHFGASNEFRQLYGCRTVMSRVDTEMLRDQPAGALMELNPNPHAQLPFIDLAFEDGAVFDIGQVSIRCVLTPGHSPGNTAYFFNVQEGGTHYQTAYFGGAGFNWLHKEFLDRHGFPQSLRQDFIESIGKVRHEAADIVLGSHPAQYAPFEKLQRRSVSPERNPFVDPSEWDRYLSRLLDEYRLFLDQGL